MVTVVKALKTVKAVKTFKQSLEGQGAFLAVLTFLTLLRQDPFEPS